MHQQRFGVESPLLSEIVGFSSCSKLTYASSDKYFTYEIKQLGFFLMVIGNKD